MLTSMSNHPPTRAYVERRTQDSLPKPEIMRCLKRYVARELFPLVRNIVNQHDTPLDKQRRGTVDELFADLVDGRVAVVFTHDAVVRAAVAWALGTGPEIYRHVEVANCSITTVGVVAGVRRLVRTNENAHLEGLALEP